MTQEASGIPDDLQELRRRFEEVRSTQPLRARLPETLWTAAAELAKHYGVHPTARALRLDYSGLRRRVKNQPTLKRKRTAATPTSFLEFVAPGAQAVTSCMVEVESAHDGKLRLELKAVATTELANLIRAFAT